MDLDEILEQAAPATTVRRTPELEQALHLLATDAESRVRRPRRRRRIAVVAAATTGVLGLGTAGAMAVGVMPGWTPWTTGSGSSCEMRFTADPGVLEPNHVTVTYSEAEQRRAADDATRFLGSFDYHSIDEADAIARFKRAENAALASEAPGERQPRLTGDDLSLTAVGDVVWQRLAAHLRADGFAHPEDAVVFVQGWRCR